MNTRREVIDYCLTAYREVYEDYPFHDPNWTVLRHRGNRRVFAWIYERDGVLCVNVKCAPEWIAFWRSAFPGVLPGYHLNKKHWNTILLNGSVPEEDVKRMIGESYDLTNSSPGKLQKEG